MVVIPIINFCKTKSVPSLLGTVTLVTFLCPLHFVILKKVSTETSNKNKVNILPWYENLGSLCSKVKKCLNVRQKLGTWQTFKLKSHSHILSIFLTLTLFQSPIHSLSTWWTTFVFISMLKSHSHTLSLSDLSHFLTLTLFQSLIHSLSTCWTIFVFSSMLKIRSL